MQLPVLRVRDFRILDHVEWSPDGVTVLTGANGAGKSTLLSAFVFLSKLFQHGVEDAFRAVDGVAFQRWDAPTDTPVEFSLEVGDVHWKLRFPMSAQGAKGTYGEELYHKGQPQLRAAMFSDIWYLGTEQQPRDTRRCCARVLWDQRRDEWLKPLVGFLEGLRVYERVYWLNKVKSVTVVDPANYGTYLHETGQNLWSVLSNWKSSPMRHAGRFEWVLEHARQAFPGVIEAIEFDRGLPYVYRHRSDPGSGLLPNRIADGLAVGLLHLTAVAGAEPSSLIAFDEIENHLHPHAIRILLSAMKRRAEEHDLTIVLTTHSPVVLNQFRHEPEQVFVLATDERPLPKCMTDLHSEEWLAQAKLGSLYERLAFGSPDLSKLTRDAV